MDRSRRFKDTVYEYFASIGKAMASPKRLEILDLLCQGEKSVEHIAQQTQLDIKNASAPPEGATIRQTRSLAA